MISSKDALAEKIAPFEAIPVDASAQAFAGKGANGPEKQLAALLGEIESDEVGAPVLKAQPLHYKSDRLLRGFIVTDALALVAGFTAAWMLAAWVNSLFLDRTPLDAQTNSLLIVALQFGLTGAGILLWFGYSSHYQLRIPFWAETKKIVETAGFALLVSCFIQFASKQNFSRLWLLSYCLFSILAIVALRAAWRAAMRRAGLWQIATLVIGSGVTAAETCHVLEDETNLGHHVVARIKELPEAFQAAGFSWKALCRKYKADHVIIALDGDAFARARLPLAQLMREHIPFSVAPPMHNLSVAGSTPQSFLGRDVMLLSRNSGLDRRFNRLIKRGFDIVAASAGLLVLGPFILAVALIVRRDGGKAFYRHKRIGLYGEVFECFKLRSMIANSDEVLNNYLNAHPLARVEWQRDHKLRNDPRTTRIGKFLRRTSLDELPQLLNVLRGEMSIVGPRPIIVAEAAKYDSDIAFYYRVRPGITGLWQVSGRNDVSYAERVRMDSWYVRNWNLWNDIAIICKTFSAVWNKSGAY